MTARKFYIRSGLSIYALACGYRQEVTIPEPDDSGTLQVVLYADSACYHVVVHSDATGRLAWISENNIADARAQWKRLVQQHCAEVFREVWLNSRYSVARNNPFAVGHGGGPWVARVDDELIKEQHSVGCTSREQAYGRCALHMRSLLNAPA